MAFRFWRRAKIAPGITLNLSKGGPSISFGPRGARLTATRKGGRVTAGIPGTGLFYTKKLEKGSRRSGRTSGSHRAAGVGAGASGARSHYEDGPIGIPPSRCLTLSFFQKLLMPKEEENFVYGCREYVMGHRPKALEFLSQSTHIADGAYLAGLVAIKEHRKEEALGYLETAERGGGTLGEYFRKYGIAPEAYMHITDEIGINLGANTRDVLLLLVELYEEMGRLEEAKKKSELLLELDPGDAAVKLSHAELLYSINPKDARNCKKIINLTEGVENDSPVHAALLLYKARSLHELKLLSAAKDILTALARRKKDRPDDLMCAIYYERSQVYEDLGQEKKARADLERVFTIDPDYEDVGKKLGIDV
jgi:tetratricopeptide (TPR) repeat protein